MSRRVHVHVMARPDEESIGLDARFCCEPDQRETVVYHPRSLHYWQGGHWRHACVDCGKYSGPSEIVTVQ